MAFVHFEENAGDWTFEILETHCKPYTLDWKEKLTSFNGLPAKDYFLLHTAYGHWLGNAVNDFMEERNLNYRVQLIASHGHTTFHDPAKRMTAQLGDGQPLQQLPEFAPSQTLEVLIWHWEVREPPLCPLAKNYYFRIMIYS